MKKLQPSVTVAILRGERTEAMKAVRRIYGDRGGVLPLLCKDVAALAQSIREYAHWSTEG